MASSPHPDNERERFPVPWEDDDTPGLSVHALTKEDVEAILASMPDEPDDEPPLRLPSLQRAAEARQERRAYGTPGGTAQAVYQRRHAVEHAAWARTLPLRIAATALAGVGGLLVAAVAGLPLPASLLISAVVTGAAWWRLRFRPSPEAAAWRRAADGERHVACLLDPLAKQGWGVEHDLPVRGATANVNHHVVIGPPGIFAIDVRHYRGRLRLSRDGLLWHGRTFLLPTLSATRSKADRLQDRVGAPDIAVVPIVAVLGGMVPGGQVTSMGVTVVPARRLPGLLRSLPPTLTPQRSREVAAQMNRRLDSSSAVDT
jgi:hypothetical protein